MGRVNIELDPLVVSDWPGSERVARLQLPSLRGPSRANAAGRTGSSPRLYWPPKGNSSQSCQGPEGPPSSACAAGSQESRHTHERLGRDDRRVRWAPALMGIPLNEPVGVPPDSGARPDPPAIAAASPSPRSASAWGAASWRSAAAAGEFGGNTTSQVRPFPTTIGTSPVPGTAPRGVAGTPGPGHASTHVDPVTGGCWSAATRPTGELAFYRGCVPRSAPPATLVRSAGIRCLG